MRGIWLTLALVLTSTSALAKSHFLPDYQGAGLDHRVQETDKTDNGTTTNTCSTYGLYSSTQSNMVCSATHPTVGLTCYSCQSCGSEYQYTTVECPTSTYTLSEQCGGKYKNCSCNTALYPTTSTTTGCPSGQVPDTNKYCEDKPSGTKHYACTNLNCNPENITVDECKAKGNNCTASKEANCTDYCDTNGCQDNCTYLEQTGQARSDCQYGCATGKDVSGCSDLCYECGEAPEAPTNTCADIYDGKSNTTAIINQLGADALAATAANQYYVGDKDGDFGQGKWYLPSIGELVDMYGVAPDQITSGSGKTGATGGYIERINNALIALYDNGGDADILSNHYWSSSPHDVDNVWILTASSANGSGNRSYTVKDAYDHIYVRPFLQVESCFNTSGSTIPVVGRVMYADKTWGSAGSYYSGYGKKPVGIIASVNKTDGSVKIVSLKNLTFSSIDSSGNFDADKPYGGTSAESAWAPYNKRGINITGVPNYSSDQLKTMLAKCATKEEENNCPVNDVELSAIFDGKSNTQKIVAQLGNEALAAYATTQFYVGDKNGTFGQGNWYLPAIGELIDMYGIDISKMTDGYSNSGAVGDNKDKINATLTMLKDLGVEAEALTDWELWSSSEINDSSSWLLNVSDGSHIYNRKNDHKYLRPSMLVKGCITVPFTGAPRIGDIMYEDNTCSSAEYYNGKIPVGIVVAVSITSGSVKIISLKELTFSSYNYNGNFDPDNPYGGSTKLTQWTTVDKYLDNIDSLGDVDFDDIFSAFTKCNAYYEW